MFVLFGNKPKVAEIRELIRQNPLLYKGNVIKEKEYERYLGDFVGQSVEASAEIRRIRSGN